MKLHVFDFEMVRILNAWLISIEVSGVRYITEDLIKKISKQDQLGIITTLNLTLSKEGGKKIKVGCFFSWGWGGG